MLRLVHSINTVFVSIDISIPEFEHKFVFNLTNIPSEVQVSQICFSDENTQNHPYPPTSFITSNLIIEPNNVLFSFVPNIVQSSSTILHRISTLENITFDLKTFKNNEYILYSENDIDIKGVLSFCLTFIEYEV